MRLDLAFDVARVRLANLIHESTLLAASRDAYGEGQAVVRVGPLGDAPGLSKVVEVRFRDLVMRGDSALLTSHDGKPAAPAAACSRRLMPTSRSLPRATEPAY